MVSDIDNLINSTAASYRETSTVPMT